MSDRTDKPLSPALKFFIARVFPLPFLAAGILALVIGVRGLARASASTTWPVVAGVVANSTIERQSGSDTGTYHAALRYTYVVDGTNHSGSRVAYGDFGSSDPAHAQHVVNQYPVGAQVTVHYMPSNPDESLLEPGLSAKAWVVPSVGAVFTIVGVLMLVFLPRLRMSSP